MIIFIIKHQTTAWWLPEHCVLISFPFNQLVSVKRFAACAFFCHIDLMVHETNATTVRSLIFEKNSLELVPQSQRYLMKHLLCQLKLPLTRCHPLFITRSEWCNHLYSYEFNLCQSWCLGLSSRIWLRGILSNTAAQLSLITLRYKHGKDITVLESCIPCISGLSWYYIIIGCSSNLIV